MTNIDYCLHWLENIINNKRDVPATVENVFINLSARSHLDHISNDALPLVEFCLNHCSSSFDKTFLSNIEIKNIVYELNSFSQILEKANQTHQSEFLRNYADFVKNSKEVCYTTLLSIIATNWEFLKSKRITYQYLGFHANHINLCDNNETKTALIHVLCTVLISWEYWGGEIR